MSKSHLSPFGRRVAEDRLVYLLRTFRLRRLFLPLSEGSEKLIGIRSASCHLHKPGIQCPICFLRLTGAFRGRGIFVYTVLDEKGRSDMEDVMDGIRQGGNLSQLLQFLVHLVEIRCRRFTAQTLKDLFDCAGQPCIHFQNIRNFTGLSFPLVFGRLQLFKLMEQPVILCKSVMVINGFRNVPILHQ